MKPFLLFSVEQLCIIEVAIYQHTNLNSERIPDRDGRLCRIFERTQSNACNITKLESITPPWKPIVSMEEG